MYINKGKLKLNTLPMDTFLPSKANPISGDVEAPQLQGVFKTSRLLTDKDADIFSVSRIAAKIKLQANQLFSIGWCSSMWSQRVSKPPKKSSLLLLFNRTLEVAKTALVGLPNDRFNLLNFFWNGVLESKYDP